MPNILRPDMKAIVWAAIGFIVIPKIMAAVSSR
jgi:hypothetical protein